MFGVSTRKHKNDTNTFFFFTHPSDLPRTTQAIFDLCIDYTIKSQVESKKVEELLTLGDVWMGAVAIALASKDLSIVAGGEVWP